MSQMLSQPKDSAANCYASTIGSAPLLTRDEERSLAERVADGDPEARERLLLANLRLVVHIARDYRERGLEMDDLIAEGNLGLIRAVESFDVSFGTRFSTYASFWIKQSIRAAIANKSSAIRLPVHMVNLLRKWKRAQSLLFKQLGREPSFEEVAGRLGLDERRRQMVRRALQAGRIQGSVGEHVDGDQLLTWPDASESSDAVVERAEDCEALRDRMGHLAPREKIVLELRFGLNGQEPRTLREVGDQLGLTREWVRRIEIRAMTQLGADVAPAKPVLPAPLAARMDRSA